MLWNNPLLNPKLITSQNTRAAERAVRSAAAHRFGRGKKFVFYEHGQWWVELPNGAQYAAVDTSGGIDFEQVSSGEDYSENPAHGTVQYAVDLGSPYETVTLFRGPRNELLAHLNRFGRPIAVFKPSKGQLAKIDRQMGKIHITNKQIERAHLYMSPFGR